MIKEIESTAGTLGGFSEVYHDNDVDDPHDSTDSIISNSETVTTGIHNTSEGDDMPPVNNPPSDNSIRGKPEDRQKQSLITVSVGSAESMNQ